MIKRFRTAIRKFKPGRYCYCKYLYYIHDINKTTCQYVFGINLGLLTNNKINFSRNFLDKIAKRFDAVITDYNLGIIQFEVSGESKCHELDRFDEMIGEKISVIKAKRQANHIAEAITNYIHHEIFNISQSMTAIKLDLDSMCNAQDKYMRIICQ